MNEADCHDKKRNSLYQNGSGSDLRLREFLNDRDVNPVYLISIYIWRFALQVLSGSQHQPFLHPELSNRLPVR